MPGSNAAVALVIQFNVMKLLGQTIDAAESSRQLFTVHRAFVWLLLATALLDVLSTIAFMSVAGIEREHNWIVRQLTWQLGLVAGPVLGKLFQLGAVWALVVMVPRLTRFICATVILVNLLAFMVNMYVFGTASINTCPPAGFLPILSRDHH